MSSIYVYWDESHLWGLMALRALRAWNLDHRLVRGSEIAQGLLSDNPPALLLVPGGRAKGKMDRLGETGQREVRKYVAGGGSYLGFCGGAGLALSPAGLELTQWTRRGFTDRLQHFLSGHVRVRLHEGHELVPEAFEGSALLPVWWPGQFEPVGGDMDVLAEYVEPGPDFWVADLALKTLPPGTSQDWENLYGVRIQPDFLTGRPCTCAGTHGKGRVVLSYAHLETPASPQANAWLAHILSTVLEANVAASSLPAWDLTRLPVLWDDPVLTEVRSMLEKSVSTGQDHFLLFWRTPWLLGWRRGIPGSQINALYALVCETMSHEPSEKVAAFWDEHSRLFSETADLLAEGLTGYLLAERLALTLAPSDPDAVQGLRQQRQALFGPPQQPGGPYQHLLDTLEELYWLHNQPA